MPSRTPTKRTARMTTSTKRRAAIEKRQLAVTLITTLVDATGLIIYFSIAKVILGV